MTDCFSFEPANGPLLISIPHDGRELAPGMADRMTETGLALPDTDWHVRLLYEFAISLGAGVIAAHFSRYVVDLNRPGTDDPLYAGQLSTGLCPTQTFAGEDIYLAGAIVDDAERQRRLEHYWLPYHSKIEGEISRIKGEFGYALLWDAHSIRTRVPGLFAGELPDLNIGSNDGRSCSPILETAVVAAASDSPFSSVLNGRFKGGHITRHFGRPQDNVHALQLELAQHSYMDETSGKYESQGAGALQKTLRSMLAAYLDSAGRSTT